MIDRAVSAVDVTDSIHAVTAMVVEEEHEAEGR